MQRFKLGDVAREVRETYRGDKTDIPIVGLAHLNPGEIKLTNWDVNTENTFSKVFKKGHVLFGRRRAYLQKAAVAHFDGICSGDITVIEAKPDKILPELLPFIIQNELFFNYAVGKSAGSLSPRVKWQQLKEYEITLPNLKEQETLKDILWAIEDTIDSYRELIEKTDILAQSKFNENLKTIDKVKKFKQLVRYLKQPKLNASDENVNGKFPLFVSSNIQDKRINTAEYDDECLLIGNGGTANVTYYNGPFSATSHMYICKANKEYVLTKYLYIYLYSNLDMIQKGFRGSGLQNVSKTHINNLSVLVPSIEEQERLINLWRLTEKINNELSDSILESVSIKNKIIENKLIKGDGK